MHRNHNHEHVIITTDLAGRELPVRAPLPEPVFVCTEAGAELTPLERVQVERFIRWWSVQVWKRAA